MKAILKFNLSNHIGEINDAAEEELKRALEGRHYFRTIQVIWDALSRNESSEDIKKYIQGEYPDEEWE